MIIHDDKPRLYWKLAIVENLIKGNDGLVQAANVRIENYMTTRPIVKLYPLEVSSCDQHQNILNDAESSRDNNVGDNAASDTTSNEIAPSRSCGKRKASIGALQRMREWTSVLCGLPEDVQN